MKNRIITQKNNGLPYNYLDKFITRINQTIFIYVNNDISKFNEEFFKYDIKKTNIDKDKYHDSFIVEISSQIEYINSKYLDCNSLSMPNIKSYFIQKKISIKII